MHEIHLPLFSWVLSSSRPHAPSNQTLQLPGVEGAPAPRRDLTRPTSRIAPPLPGRSRLGDGARARELVLLVARRRRERLLDGVKRRREAAAAAVLDVGRGRGARDGADGRSGAAGRREWRVGGGGGAFAQACRLELGPHARRVRLALRRRQLRCFRGGRVRALRRRLLLLRWWREGRTRQREPRRRRFCWGAAPRVRGGGRRRAAGGSWTGGAGRLMAVRRYWKSWLM